MASVSPVVGVEAIADVSQPASLHGLIEAIEVSQTDTFAPHADLRDPLVTCFIPDDPENAACVANASALVPAVFSRINSAKVADAVVPLVAVDVIDLHGFQSCCEKECYAVGIGSGIPDCAGKIAVRVSRRECGFSCAALVPGPTLNNCSVPAIIKHVHTARLVGNGSGVWVVIQKLMQLVFEWYRLCLQGIYSVSGADLTMIRSRPVNARGLVA